MDTLTSHPAPCKKKAIASSHISYTHRATGPREGCLSRQHRSIARRPAFGRRQRRRKAQSTAAASRRDRGARARSRQRLQRNPAGADRYCKRCSCCGRRGRPPQKPPTNRPVPPPDHWTVSRASLLQPKNTINRQIFSVISTFRRTHSAQRHHLPWATVKRSASRMPPLSEPTAPARHSPSQRPRPSSNSLVRRWKTTPAAPPATTRSTRPN